MTDKVQKIRKEVERLREKIMGIRTDFADGQKSVLTELLVFIDSLQEEPKDKCKGCNNVKGCLACVDGSEWAHYEEFVSKDYRERYKNIAQSDAFKSAYKNKSLGEVVSVEEKKPVSEELEEASRNYADNEEYGDDVYFAIKAAFKVGAKWQKENLWKPADGDDLPIIDREVVVLIKYNAQRNIHDEEYPTYRVGFGHIPNPNGWDGKNIDTNEVTHYTPKLYDKGGWNAPNIVYWLDARLPYEENKIDKEIEP